MGFAREGEIRRQLGFAVACFALFAAVYQEGVRVRALDSAWVVPPADDPVRWNPRLARVFSFGQVPSVVDWMWLRLLQDADLSHVSEGNHPSTYYDLILATDLDPKYYEAYTVGADILSIIRNDNTGALELIRRAQEFASTELPSLGPGFARRFWSPAWSIPMTRAYLDLFEFNNLPGAAEAFKAASELPYSPQYLQHLVSRLSTREGQFDVGAKLLQFKLDTLGRADTNGAREALRRKIHDFQLSRFLFEINERFDAFLSQRKKGRLDRATAFPRFLAAAGERGLDPEGGQLKLDDKGRIITTTPHQNVLGMEQQ